MLLIQLMVELHYGMLEFFGHGVLASSSTPTREIQVFDQFLLIGKVSRKEIHCP